MAEYAQGKGSAHDASVPGSDQANTTQPMSYRSPRDRRDRSSDRGRQLSTRNLGPRQPNLGNIAQSKFQDYRQGEDVTQSQLGPIGGQNA